MINLKKIEHVLRFAVFMTFLGHGIFALMGTAKWLIYLETVGFSLYHQKNNCYYWYD